MADARSSECLDGFVVADTLRAMGEIDYEQQRAMHEAAARSLYTHLRQLDQAEAERIAKAEAERKAAEQAKLELYAQCHAWVTRR